ncbi:MAG TPA: energy transducer TonB [Pyrinomonadaceae bacterium]|nr:energy transducer TonB [Pyrinomonadaceae bacterium]
MSYRTKWGFLLTALLLSALNVHAQGQGAAASASTEAKPVAASSSAVSDSERARDGLNGPVRRVRTELAKLATKSGNTIEGQRTVLETASYDIKGNKLENAYYPVAGETLTGREVYKYDERGNISEMTLHGPDGSLISKETYAYEFDFVGNWTKMTTSVAVIEGGKVNFEPTEITYRTITYYLDENMAKMVQPASSGASANASSAPSPSSSPAVKPEVKAESKPAAAGAANGNHAAAATVKTQTSAPLPVARTVDTSNIVPGSNRSGNITGGVDSKLATSGATAAVVRVDDAGEPPVKPMPKPLMKPVSGGVLNGQATDLPKPEYPEIARHARATGVVSVEVVIDETGKVISARAVSGSPFLREAAVKAAKRARFTPSKLSGQPVKVSGVVNYNFAAQ